MTPRRAKYLRNRERGRPIIYEGWTTFMISRELWDDHEAMRKWLAMMAKEWRKQSRDGDA